MGKIPEAIDVTLAPGHAAIPVVVSEPATVGRVLHSSLPIGAATEDTLRQLLTEKTVLAALAKVVRGWGASDAAPRVTALSGNEHGSYATSAGPSDSQTQRVTIAADCRPELASKHDNPATPLAARLSDGKVPLATGAGHATDSTLRVVVAEKDQPQDVAIVDNRAVLKPLAAGGVLLRDAPLGDDWRPLVSATQKAIKRAVVKTNSQSGILLLGYVKDGHVQNVAAGIDSIDVDVEIPAGVQVVVKALAGTFMGLLAYTFLG